MRLPALKIGSAGGAVQRLRSILALRGYFLARGDVFDVATHEAVVSFQKNSGLEPDGVVGVRTWEKLNDGVREVANWRGLGVALVALGESARGVRESGGDNRGADVEVYQGVTGMKWQAWCASFVTWCYSKMGLHLRDAKGFASVEYMAHWAKGEGHWRPRSSGYTPPVGAVAVFRFSRHSGIVLAAGSSRDSTIEGNTRSDRPDSLREGVFRKTRSHRSISGYVVLPEICTLSL